MGSERGLRHFRHLLPRGYLALTEMNWLGSERPAVCRELFARFNLPVLDIRGTLELIAEVGFRMLGHFVLPASSWWTDYYTPLLQRLAALRQEHPDDSPLQEMIGLVEEEIEVYRSHGQAYGYVFYVMQA
ncbi:MAG TPA: hypothetical protein PKK12_10375 [Candidatus Aminicenantes bacterium]|nr:hypothetical protein [Candidatus Aminicenantes bacterium]